MADLCRVYLKRVQLLRGVLRKSLLIPPSFCLGSPIRLFVIIPIARQVDGFESTSHALSTTVMYTAADYKCRSTHLEV